MPVPSYHLIDTHAHLDHIENFESAMADSAKAGVSAVLAVSTDLKAMRRNLEIKRRAESGERRGIKIYLGLGIHPGDIKTEELEESCAFIRENIKDADVIGEIGMDFWYKWVRKDEEKHREQREVFRRQLEIAKEFDKPVVVHTRGTWKECLQTVKEAGIKRANFHWYSGPVEVLEDIIKTGYYVSSGPALAFSPQSREAIRHAPLEQLLIETDSPVFFNYPEEMGGGFKAIPKDVFRSLDALAKLKGIDPEKAAEILNKNAEKFILG